MILMERLENFSKRFQKKVLTNFNRQSIIKKEVDIMKKICFKHNYRWMGEFIGTSTDLISGRKENFEMHEILCTCEKCGKQKSFKFKKILDKG